MHSFPRILLCAISLTCTVSISSGQGHKTPDLQDVFKDPMPYVSEALGVFTRPISTASEEAQGYFDQGMQLKYSFGVVDAARSFREAQKLDPNNAFCHWGEAWAWGSYLNQKMSKKNAPRAYAAIQKAQERVDENTPAVEQALIQAMSIRYVEKFDPETQTEQDTAYADAMRTVYESFPNDLDVATLYAEALFLLEPRRGYRDIEDPDVQRIHRVLEKVLAIDLKHPGAGHLYIHATESTSQPGKALAVAEVLGDLILGASHMNHMPSHIFNEVGFWGKSVRANIQAWHSDQRAKEGRAFAIYSGHNLHMLLYSASYDGQGAIAIQAARDNLATYADQGSSENRERAQALHLLTLVRFGRFGDITEAMERPGNVIYGGIWDFAQGYAHLRSEAIDFARVYLDRVKTAATSDTKAKFRGHSAADLLGTISGILEGEILRAEGDLGAAITALELAVTNEDSMTYDEPEPLPFSSRHWLGAALLEVGKFSQAETVYREELADHPTNGWSLFGLKEALRGQNKPADDIEHQFKDHWSRSEVYLQASRF